MACRSGARTGIDGRAARDLSQPNIAERTGSKNSFESQEMVKI
jgi:hypothetical protein